jgi:hypothetical protein
MGALVDVVNCSSIVAQMLNATTPGTFSSTIIDPKFSTLEVSNAVLSADGMIAESIMRNLNNSRRALFYSTQIGIANGGQIGAASGPIDTVQFTITGGTMPGNYSGTETDAEEIRFENRNPLALTQLDPHYHADGKVLYHNGVGIAALSGGTVSVNPVYTTFSLTTACQCPAELTDAVIAIALKTLVPVEGSNVEAGKFWWTIAQVYLGAVSTGEATVPSLRSILSEKGGAPAIQ